MPTKQEIEAAKQELARRELERRSQKRSFGRELMRQGGLTVRALAEGAADVVSPFTEPVRWLQNQTLGRIPGFPQATQSPLDLMQSGLSAAGVPTPETTPEKISNFAGRIITGMGAGSVADDAVVRGLGYQTRLPQAPRTPPTVERLKDLSQQAYRSLDAEGTRVPSSAITDLYNKVASTVAREGFDPDLHPRVATALARFSRDSGDDLSLTGLETLRKVVKGAASSADASERRLAQMIVNNLDDFVEQSSVVPYQARNLWARASKGEEIAELISRARVRAPNFSASGLENAVRTEFRQLALNPRRMRLFNQAEQAAIRKVAQGGPLENALRMLGKLAPRGVVSSALSGGAGYAIGGPLGAAVTMGAGEAGRLGATALTLRNARIAEEMMRRGGPFVGQGLRPILGPTAGAIGPAGSMLGQVPYIPEMDEQQAF